MKKFKIGIEDLTWTFSTKKTYHFLAFCCYFSIAFSCFFFLIMSKTLQSIFNVFTHKSAFHFVNRIHFTAKFFSQIGKELFTVLNLTSLFKRKTKPLAYSSYFN